MFWNAVVLALREVRRNALRSSLTILGIVIGVAAVIIMVTLGNGATAQVTADIAKLGSNLLQLRPGQGFRGGGARSQAPLFKVEDAVAIAREIPDVEAVAPVVRQQVQAIAGNTNWSTSVHGSTNAYLETRNWDLENGRMFNDAELRSGQSVCIIGETVRKQLFGKLSPLGEKIRLEKLSCTVIGLLQPKGQSGFGSDQDDFVLMPLRTVQRRIVGSSDVDLIYVSAREGVSTEKVEKDIEALMRERRRIAVGAEDDFFVMDMQEITSTMTGTTRVLTGLLGAVAAVSLLVGGIGIMNIMLVSVTERTREIGIRLAVGAQEGDVLSQFLVEAVVLACFGGLTGIAVGISGAALMVRILQVPFVLDPGIVLIAFLFSAAVGVVFGYFPARQAARLDPIEALRHE